MKPLYEAVGRILENKGLSTHKILAGCARCGACSAMSAYETDPAGLICHSARNRAEQQEAFRIRKTVFVDEQALFDGTDRDENDTESIHLVAKQQGRIIGTVRVYRDHTGPDRWIGGRLAVEKKFRATSAGSRLVKEAMKRVKKKGCDWFTAHIQERNIPFFLRLGWQPMAPVKHHFGRPHQKMRANLNLVAEDIDI